MQTIIAPDVPSLTAMFTILYFLAATQDIAVDGWAITMLRPENVGYASTCNAIGQSTGWVLGYVVFTSLEAAGIMDLSQFLLFWGIVFLVITTSIALFKKEKTLAEIAQSEQEGAEEEQELELGLVQAYKMLWKIIVSPRMYVWIFFLLTNTFGCSAAESIFGLKLIEFGVPRESIAQLSLPMIPVKIVVTALIARFTVGPRPLNVWLGSLPVRMILCAGFTVFVSSVLSKTLSHNVPPKGLRHSPHEAGRRRIPKLLLRIAYLPCRHPQSEHLLHERGRDGFPQQDFRPHGGRHLHDPPQHLLQPRQQVVLLLRSLVC